MSAIYLSPLFNADINIKYPGLETRVKSKVMSIFNKATSVSDLIKNAFSEILLVGGEAAQTIRKILEDLIKNIKLIITPSSDKNEDASDHFMVRRDIDLDVLRQKIKDCKCSLLRLSNRLTPCHRLDPESFRSNLLLTKDGTGRNPTLSFTSDVL